MISEKYKAAEEKINEDLKGIHQILVDNFNTAELRSLVVLELKTDTENIASLVPKKLFITEMLLYFKRRDRLHEVVMAARQARSNDEELYDYAVKVGLAAPLWNSETEEDIDLGNLEAILDPEFGIPNLLKWRRKLGRIENQVCLVKIKTADMEKEVDNGTGFLVGEDLVLTNHHVLESFINYDCTPKRINEDAISLHFGFFTDDGKNETPNSDGKVYTLSPDDWLQGCSQSDDLDFALIKLKRKASKDIIGQLDHTDEAARGYIKIPSKDDLILKKNMPLFIVQHPRKEDKILAESEPMSIAVNFVSNIQNNRIKYRTNTRKGSSGSPCFDHNWNLVALHHWGSKRGNRGIPIDKIADALSARNIKLG